MTYQTVLASWTATLEPVLGGLQSAVSEFVPYIVYIWLGVLVATIGFTAVRWLMNWTSAKIKGTFKGGRRRR